MNVVVVIEAYLVALVAMRRDERMRGRSNWDIPVLCLCMFLGDLHKQREFDRHTLAFFLTFQQLLGANKFSNLVDRCQVGISLFPSHRHNH